MENECKVWLERLFEDKNMKLKHFKTLIFIFKQSSFNEYTKLDISELMSVCEIKKTKTLNKILNYFLENKYIYLKVDDNGYYCCLNNNTEGIKQNIKKPINLENLKDRENFLTEQLLNPFYTWGRIPKQKRIEIINTYNEEEIRRILTNKNFRIDYSSFLLTPYWKTIKDIVKQKYNNYQICGSKSNLHIHHLTYEHHFYEHLYIDDLVALCKKCHQKVHKK